MDLDFVSVHKNAKKELGQYPAILTSRLVNNAYVLFYRRNPAVIKFQSPRVSPGDKPPAKEPEDPGYKIDDQHTNFRVFDVLKFIVCVYVHLEENLPISSHLFLS